MPRTILTILILGAVVIGCLVFAMNAITSFAANVAEVMKELE